MNNKKINGLKIANKVLKQIDEKITKIKMGKNLPQHSQVPRLGIILVGNNAASLSYLKRKKYSASKASIKTRIFHLNNVNDQSSAQISRQLGLLIQKLNKDTKYHGILLQLPLHQKIASEEDKFLDLIDPKKDVDCLGSQNRKVFENQGKKAEIIPCVVKGVMQMLNDKKIKIKNKNVLLIGQGKLVGLPLKSYLSYQCKHLVVADANTPLQQLKIYALNADVIISATGKQDILPQQSLKKGCVIIDVGVSPDPKNPSKVRGDFSQDLKTKVCSYYSPVPKGIGPMTIASLIGNVFNAWKSQINVK